MNEKVNIGEYKGFINSFAQAMATMATTGKRYVSRETHYQGFSYATTQTKLPGFKTEQIAAISDQCLEYISTNSEPLNDRLQLLQSLNDSLKTYATRIENSIKTRWWYYILQYFGYRAKCPENIRKLILQSGEILGGLKLSVAEAKPVKSEPVQPNNQLNQAVSNPIEKIGDIRGDVVDEDPVINEALVSKDADAKPPIPPEVKPDVLNQPVALEPPITPEVKPEVPNQPVALESPITLEVKPDVPNQSVALESPIAPEVKPDTPNQPVVFEPSPILLEFANKQEGYLPLIKEYYRVNPSAPDWNEIKKASPSSPLFPLRPVVVALELTDLLAKPFDANDEGQTSRLIDQIRTLIQTLGSINTDGGSYINLAYGDKETEEMINIVLQHVDYSMDEAKVRALTRAFLSGIHGPYEFNEVFIKALTKSNRSILFDPLFKELICLCAPSEKIVFPKLMVASLIKESTTKQHAAAFLAACRPLPEPLQSLHFRALAHGLPNGVSSLSAAQMAEVFTEEGLEIGHYLPIPSNCMMFAERQFFNEIRSMQTPDQLASFLVKIKIKSQTYTEQNLLFRALVAGIRVTDTTILRISLSQEAIQQVFDEYNSRLPDDPNVRRLFVSSFNEVINVDDFLKS